LLFKGQAVAVRSSATAEDLPTPALLVSKRPILISKERRSCLLHAKVLRFPLTDRAIIYRIEKGFKHDKVALSIGIQKMVRADLGASGVLSLWIQRAAFAM